MTFANEMKDFLGAFTVMRESIGSAADRDAAKLDLEWKRANIDYLRSKTQGDVLDLPPYDPPVIDDTFTTDPGGDSGGDGGGGTSGGGITPTPPDFDWTRAAGDKPSAWVSATGDKGGTMFSRPPSGAAKTATKPAVPAETAESVPSEPAASADPGALAAAGMTPPRPTARPTARRGGPSYAVAIKDRTSLDRLQPWTRARFDSLANQAQGMGLKLVVTAGGGPGHLSHAGGTELDFYGVHPDGSRWTPDERARVGALGARLGFNRFGLYPGGSMHMGRSGGGRPSAMWGAGGRTSGASSRAYTDPADRWLYSNFASGKLFSGRNTEAVSSSDPEALAAAGMTGGGGMANWAAYIQQAAQARGIDPNIALRVARSEGLAPGVWQSNVRSGGKREPSYGPFQLYTGGGLGNQFVKAGYGDPSDPSTVYKQIDFALDHAAANGWGAWHGAQAIGLDNWAGLKNAKAIGVSDRTYTGGIEGGGDSSSLAGGTLDDEFTSYPESRTKDDTTPAAEQPPSEPGPGAGPGVREDVPVPTPIVHKVVKNDTLWDLAEKYDLETYMQIVEANKDKIKNPDLIYPGQEFVIPGTDSGAVPEEETPTSYTPFEQEDAPPGLRPQARPSQHPTSSTGDTVDIGPNVRPSGGPGALPPDSYTPTSDEPQAELQRAMDRRDQIATDDTGDPATKEALLQALDVKIQQLSYATGGTGGSTPTETVRPVEQRPGLNQRAQPIPRVERATIDESIRDYREKQRATGPGPGAVELAPTALEEGVASADTEALDAAGMSGGGDAGFATATPGGAVGDELGLAQQSIDAVNNLWDLSPSGHLVLPNGREMPEDTFQSGKKAGVAGRGWLARFFFGDSAVEADNPAEDDDTEDDSPADNLLRGAGALHKTHMQQVHAVVDAWAERHGITLSESERNIRSLGMLYDYWIANGEPEKAQAIAGAALQYYQSENQRYAALSKALMDGGDVNGAVKAMVKGYAQIPDGRDFKVTGDPAGGWQYTYINEETGREITKGILTPDQMFGMIMNQSPADMDKFLYRAAGQENLDEAGPELTGALADLNETPAWETAPFDPIAAKQMGADDLRIYAAAIDAHNGKVAQALVERDKAALGIPTGPVAPGATAPAGTAPVAAPAGAAGAGGAVGDAGVRSGGRMPFATPPGTPSGTATPTPEVTTPGPPDHGFPGGVVIATAEDGSKIYDPGPDQTFGVGLGTDIQVQLQRIMSMGSGPGAEAQKVLLQDQETKRATEVARRQHVYAVATAAAGRPLTLPVAPKPGVGAPEEPDYNLIGAVPEGFTPAERQVPSVPGGQYEPTDIAAGITTADVPGGPVPYQRPTTQEEVVQQTVEKSPAFAPERVDQFGVAPRVPPGPKQHFGIGAPPAPDPLVRAAIGDDAVAQQIYTDLIARQTADYTILETEAKAAYTQATEIPKAKDWGKNELAAMNERIGEYLLPPDQKGVARTPEDAAFMASQEVLLRSAAQRIGELNHIGDGKAATDTVAAMINVNPAQPSMPMFVAVRHPTDATMWVVQPLGVDGGAKGQRLLVPSDMFDAIYTTWEQRSNQIISALPQGEKGAWQASPDASGYAETPNTAPRAPGQPIILGPPAVTQEYTSAVPAEPTAPTAPVEPEQSRAHPVYEPGYDRNIPHPENVIPEAARIPVVPNKRQPQYPGRGR